MTRKLLILAYIAAVLALSGMVKASEASDQRGLGVVQLVNINNTSGIMRVDGIITNPCMQSPNVVLRNIENNVVELMVETKTHSQVCIDAVVEKPFKIVFDLKEIQALVPGTVYTIKFDNFVGAKNEFSYKAIASQIDNNFKLGTKDYKGFFYRNTGLTESPNGFVLQQGDDVIPVFSPDMIPELERFKGEKVIMTGYDINIVTMNSGAKTISKVFVPFSVRQ